MTDIRIELKAKFNMDDTGVITALAWPFATPDRVGDMIEKGGLYQVEDADPDAVRPRLQRPGRGMGHRKGTRC